MSMLLMMDDTEEYSPGVALSDFAWWRADQKAAPNAPVWAAEGAHARGLLFDGVDDYVTFGDNALYSGSSIAHSYTFLVYADAASMTAANEYVYSEGASGSATQHLGIGLKNTAGQMFVIVRDDAGTYTLLGLTIAAAVTDGAWNCVTVVLDASGYGVIVNGSAIVALGTSYDNTPGTTTLNRATLGALGKNTYSGWQTGQTAYATRHSAALSLAQVRQVQQAIADAVSGDGISVSISGTETANFNSPTNQWAMTEVTGESLADSAGSVTGTLEPYTTGVVQQWTDQNLGLVLRQTASADQPAILADPTHGEQALSFAGSEWLTSTEAAAYWKWLHNGTGSTVIVVYSPGDNSNPNSIYSILNTQLTPSTSSAGYSLFWDDRASATRNERVFIGASNGISGMLAASTPDDAAPPQEWTSAIATHTGLPTATGTIRDRGADDVGSGTHSTSDVNPAGTLQVGYWPSFGSHLRGKISEILIGPRVLSAAEMNAALGYIKSRYNIPYTKVA